MSKQSDNWGIGKMLSILYGNNDVIKLYLGQHPYSDIPGIKEHEESIPENDQETVPASVYQELLNPYPGQRIDLRNCIGLALYNMHIKLTEEPNDSLQHIFSALCDKYQFNIQKLEILFEEHQNVGCPDLETATQNLATARNNDIIIALLEQRRNELEQELPKPQQRNAITSIFMSGTDSERGIKKEALEILIKAAKQKRDDRQQINIDDLIIDVKKEIEATHGSEALARFEQGIEHKSSHILRGASAFSETLQKIYMAQKNYDDKPTTQASHKKT
jgi:hypothetical protein